MDTERFFLVKTVMYIPNEETGKLKKITETFLVWGWSCTDVEAKMVQKNKNLVHDWKIISTVESKILEVIN
jgi:hypothetical protein